MPPVPVSSARREELLERAYQHALEHGLSGVSLRPLAAEIGSSPRVLLFLFGSKDDLVRALLARARADELSALARIRDDGGDDLASLAAELWRWLAAPKHRRLLILWVEAYARSLVEPDGPWADFARCTVEDWLALLGGGDAATRVLAVLRGGLLDLLATGDADRVSASVGALLADAADDRRR